MSTIAAKLTFDDALGAIFLGGIAASIIYGINCIQTFIFFKGNQADRTYLKIIIPYSNAKNMAHFRSFATQVMLGAFSDTLVRSVYVLRIWRLTHRWQYIAIIDLSGL
ncbi:hypothetical protein BDQ12DRAFT_670313 [Crucibulum laeve]|uniref:Uncharacterized protein n=1 Tax=Crucibulum laeve TaxID=68775 RepID=A0A5C3LL60_9AGAR|nr:hypothetical protein BDQ12DRAFT_670313 [Crucibulum laeve]